jgi:hypothetical protein
LRLARTARLTAGFNHRFHITTNFGFQKEKCDESGARIARRKVERPWPLCPPRIEIDPMITHMLKLEGDQPGLRTHARGQVDPERDRLLTAGAPDIGVALAVPAAVIDRGYRMAAPYRPPKQKAKSFWISLCLAGMETTRSAWLVSNDMRAPQTWSQLAILTPLPACSTAQAARRLGDAGRA